MPRHQVAVAWLRREDWSGWQAVDPEVLPYFEWLAKASDTIAHLERNGVVVEKITVDAGAFGKWCAGTASRSMPAHARNMPPRN